MRPRIIADANIPYLQGRLEPVADIEYLPQEAITKEAVREADALLVRTRTRCNADLLEDSRVSYVATGTIGTDHLDLPWLKSHGIEACNAPGCNAPGVAQYVWSSLLRLGFHPDRGERLGVVGCGNIGSIVSAWGRALGAEVWVSDPPRMRAGYPEDYHSLEEIMSGCRAVTFHTPLTRQGEDATLHLVGEKELSLLAPGSIFVNASRGGVVDNKALKAYLAAGHDVCTAIDTWEGEPAIDQELLAMTDIGTFHIAGYSRQGKSRATRMILEGLCRHFGLTVDMDGLEPRYDALKARHISAEGIVSSYNPFDDTAALKAAPDNFEPLREHYNFREEYNA